MKFWRNIEDADLHKKIIKRKKVEEELETPRELDRWRVCVYVEWGVYVLKKLCKWGR